MTDDKDRFPAGGAEAEAGAGAESGLIARIVARTRVIAVVGLSPKPERPSHRVAGFLQRAGYRIIPVNPAHAGERILGEVVYPDLASLPDPGAVDMVDVFRRAEEVLPVALETRARLPNVRTFWMQLGIRNAEAASLLRAKGIDVVEDRCPAIEWPRYLR